MVDNIILMALSLACVIYALVKYLGKKVALFSILISCAMGCFFMGYLYNLITLLVAGKIPAVFNVGMLAELGGFSFLFSASYSQMDGLVDDKSKSLSKYRLIPLVMPLAVAGAFIPVLLSANVQTGEKITTGILYVFVALAAYYNFKHLIIPDVSFGIINSIRKYSLFSVIGSLVFCAMTTLGKLGLGIPSTVCAVILALIYPCMIISMEKGRKKWIA